MRGAFSRILGAVLFSVGFFSVTSCGTPRPRAPEQVREQHAQMRPSSRLGKLALDPKRRAEVDALVAEVRLSFSDYERARLVLLDEAVVEVARGKLEYEKLRPLWDEAIRTFEAGLPHLLVGINRLHKILTRAEREQLVSLLSGGEKKSAEEKHADRQERLGRVLDLRASQKTTLYPALFTVLVKHYGFISDTEDELEEAEDAFISPEFDAREAPLIKNLDLHRMAEIYFEAAETVLKHLTPEQHKTLAAVIDARLRGEGVPKQTKNAPTKNAPSR